MILNYLGQLHILSGIRNILIGSIVILEIAIIVYVNGDGVRFNSLNAILMCFYITLLSIIAIPITMDLGGIIIRSLVRVRHLGQSSVASNVGALFKIFLLCLFGAVIGPLSILVTISSLLGFDVTKRIDPNDLMQQAVFQSYRITLTIFIYSFIGFMVSIPFLARKDFFRFFFSRVKNVFYSITGDRQGRSISSASTQRPASHLPNAGKHGI